MSYLPSDATPQPNRPLVAIGDMHGCSGKLALILDAIAKEFAARSISDADIIGLGDYVDRGDDSRAVLATLMEFQSVYPGLMKLLMGNHEKMLLDFLDRPEDRGARFLRHGGLQTLASFGVDVGGLTDRSRTDDLVSASNAFRAAMPDGMEQWIRDMPLWWQSGDVVCVHAAMDPVVPPELQESRPMLWGHPFFYKAPRPDGLWVAHGHDVVEEPMVLERRISCDTGAYLSGRLTAAVIVPGSPVKFLTV